MTRLLVIGFLLAVVSVPAPVQGGQEPSGFAGPSWGSPRTATLDLAEKHCGFTMDRAPVPTIEVSCNEYQLDGITRPVIPTLQSIDDTLQGYDIVVPLADADAFRTALIEKFGTPTLTLGASLFWKWPSGSEAMVSPYNGSATLRVVTKAVLARRAAESKQQREQIKKGF